MQERDKERDKERERGEERDIGDIRGYMITFSLSLCVLSVAVP